MGPHLSFSFIHIVHTSLHTTLNILLVGAAHDSGDGGGYQNGGGDGAIYHLNDYARYLPHKHIFDTKVCRLTKIIMETET